MKTKPPKNEMYEKIRDLKGGTREQADIQFETYLSKKANPFQQGVAASVVSHVKENLVLAISSPSPYLRRLAELIVSHDNTKAEFVDRIITRGEALDQIYELFDSLHRSGDFVMSDQIIQSFISEFDKLDKTTILGILSITNPAKEKLANRSSFYKLAVEKYGFASDMGLKYLE